MRVIDQNGNMIVEYDLSKGHLVATTAIREDANPIDNITKFAWSDEDYEEARMYIPNPIKTIQEKIKDLKQKLRETDYHIIKVMEGVSTLDACIDVMKQRALWKSKAIRRRSNPSMWLRHGFEAAG